MLAGRPHPRSGDGARRVAAVMGTDDTYSDEWHTIATGPDGKWHVDNQPIRRLSDLDPIVFIRCGSHAVGAVCCRGRNPLHWRLIVADQGDLYLGPERPDLPETFTFLCLCGRRHRLDRAKVRAAAAELQPRRNSAKARSVPLRDVAADCDA